MEQSPLGATGLSVSQVILGCGSIGGIGSPAISRGKGLSEDAGRTQLDIATGMGVNTLDTAIAYAGGESERIVGRWLRDHPDPGVLVTTKVGLPVGPGEAQIYLSAPQIQAQIEVSLSRLGRVDLLLAHRPDDLTPIEETLEAFAALVEQGKARAIGVCNVTTRQLEAALDAAERIGVPGYQWVQNGYNLLSREDEAQILPLVRERGLGYTPYSPLAAGLLAGRYERGERAPAGSRYAVFGTQVPPACDPLWRALDSASEVARQRDISLAALSLAWVMSHPDVTAPLVAPRHVAQFDDVTDALSTTLTTDERAHLGQLFDSVRDASSHR